MIRRIVTTIEDALAEPCVPADRPSRRAVVAAVIANPWLGADRVDDLQPEVERIAPAVALALCDRLLEALGGVGEVEAFGKAAIIGVDGELEHGAALIHTPFFGDVVRQALGGTSIIVFADTRGPAGTSVAVPVWHRTAAATRSHYQTIDVRVSDAPRPDELVLVVAAAAGPRPNARIGDRTTDAATITIEDLRQ